MSPTGILVMAGGQAGRWMISAVARAIGTLVLSRFVTQKFVGVLAKSNKTDLTILHGLMTSGEVTPVIDRCYRLSEVPEAIRYLKQGHARGKVVIALT